MEPSFTDTINAVDQADTDMEEYLISMGLTDEALDRGKATASAMTFTFSGSI